MKFKIAVETYIYYHTQCPGYQVRKVRTRGKTVISDVSKYFGEGRHGSLRKALVEAKAWKNHNLFGRVYDFKSALDKRNAQGASRRTRVSSGRRYRYGLR